MDTYNKYNNDREFFDNTNIRKFAKDAAENICRSYGIKESSDLAYIANVIDAKFLIAWDKVEKSLIE